MNTNKVSLALMISIVVIVKIIVKGSFTISSKMAKKEF